MKCKLGCAVLITSPANYGDRWMCKQPARHTRNSGFVSTNL